MRDTATTIDELSALIKEKQPAGISTTAFLNALVEKCFQKTDTDSSDNEAKRKVLARGIVARKKLELAEGGSLSAEEMAHALNRTRQGIDYLRKQRSLVAWHNTTGKWRYPVWQLTPDGQILPGIRECIKILSTTSEWEPIIFFLSPRHSLDGKRPLDLLRTGDITNAIKAAERHGGHGAY